MTTKQEQITPEVLAAAAKLLQEQQAQQAVETSKDPLDEAIAKLQTQDSGSVAIKSTTSVTLEDDTMNQLLNGGIKNSLNDFSMTTTPQTEVDTAVKMNVYHSLEKNMQDKAISLAKQIKDGDINTVLTYGDSAQQQLNSFSEKVLKQSSMKDVGPIGQSLDEMMGLITSTNPKDLRLDSGNFFTKMFRKVKKSIDDLTKQYQSVSTRIDEITKKLESDKNGLIEDNKILNELYMKNKEYFDQLNIYVAAGELKIEELDRVTIPQLVELAKNSNDQMDAQNVNDMIQFKDRLEKKVHDLKLARQITIQQAPQIRMIQNSNNVLATKIQSSVNTAIPLWKNQLTIAITLLRQQDASAAQRQVTETTNALFKNNADMLKMSSVEIANENERGMVDIETLQHTQTQLIETISETIEIQKQGKVARKEAERELVKMEANLKEKLLEFTKDGL